MKDGIHQNICWEKVMVLFVSAGVADFLQESFGIAVNGIVLVSNVLDIRTLSFQPGDDLPFIVNFPTYAATSWYHNKVPNKPASLDAFLKEVRAFSFGDYAACFIKRGPVGG
jgi:carboxypeptidase C (cathepsin A)